VVTGGAFGNSRTMQSPRRQFSLILPALSLARGRTTVLHGAVHLVIFGACIVTTVLP